MLTPPPPPPILPCPLTAGWQLVARTRLPHRDAAGNPSGGFSAAATLQESPELLLLSDAPRGVLSRFRFHTGDALTVRPVGPLPLRAGPGQPLPDEIDAEGLVIDGDQAWVASEGRRSPHRPPQLLRFDRGSGELQQAVALPSGWQAGPGIGLEANGGPESLTLLLRPGEPPLLLLAAEHPLRQDPPDRVRLLGLPLPPAEKGAAGRGTGAPAWLALDPLALPGPGWGLTDLLALPADQRDTGLLALLRRFEAPDRWEARLALYPLPIPAPGETPGAPLEPLASWDLLAIGLPPDNWEAITPGPGRSGEPGRGQRRASLLLASDDNFSPLQDNHLVEIAPRHTSACPSPP